MRTRAQESSIWSRERARSRARTATDGCFGHVLEAISLEIDLPLRIADKTNQRRTRYPPERSPPAATNSGH
jgi:hypothetical protein